eukprot:GHVQ01002679.1.p1 GENE.GHVQ01002679.1~~GHVQ01002679.1.p1  ORF type:complete len:733 (+),score=71.00 GHVQ01002679.1:406-2604(+)
MLELDLTRGSLHLSVYCRLLWADERLLYDGREYLPRWNSSIDSLEIHVNGIGDEAIWVPDITFANSLEHNMSERSNYSYRGQLFDQTFLKHNGWNVYWSRILVTNTRCKVDLKLYPFDTQVCLLVLTPWVGISRWVFLWNDFEVDGKPPIPYFNDDVPQDSHTYNIADVEVYSTHQPYRPAEAHYKSHPRHNYLVHPIDTLPEAMDEPAWSSCSEDQKPCVVYRLTFRRKAHYYLVNFVWPLSLMVLVAYISFWVPFYMFDRLALLLSVLIAVFALMFITAGNRPPSAGDTWLDRFQAGVIILCLIPAVETVCVTRLHTVLAKRSEIRHREQRLIMKQEATTNAMSRPVNIDAGPVGVSSGSSREEKAAQEASASASGQAHPGVAEVAEDSAVSQLGRANMFRLRGYLKKAKRTAAASTQAGYRKPGQMTRRRTIGTLSRRRSYHDSNKLASTEIGQAAPNMSQSTRETRGLCSPQLDPSTSLYAQTDNDKDSRTTASPFLLSPSSTAPTLVYPSDSCSLSDTYPPLSQQPAYQTPPLHSTSRKQESRDRVGCPWRCMKRQGLMVTRLWGRRKLGADAPKKDKGVSDETRGEATGTKTAREDTHDFGDPKVLPNQIDRLFQLLYPVAILAFVLSNYTSALPDEARLLMMDGPLSSKSSKVLGVTFIVFFSLMWLFSITSAIMYRLPGLRSFTHERIEEKVHVASTKLNEIASPRRNSQCPVTVKSPTNTRIV